MTISQYTIDQMNRRFALGQSIAQVSQGVAVSAPTASKYRKLYLANHGA